MELLYKGKTKNIYRLDSGALQIQFKDDVTGKDGVFDPAAKSILKKIPGAALSSLNLSAYYFKKLNAIDVPTHFISKDEEQATLTVKDTKSFGTSGLDVIVRFRAIGTFEERYNDFVEHGEELDSLTEMVLKDAFEDRPPIDGDTMEALHIMSNKDYVYIRQQAQDIAGFIRMDLAKKGLELYDIKFEFGRDASTNEILLINEISANSMHVYDGHSLINPIQLEEILLK